MEYNKVIAVTGLPGLYELLSSKSDGAIVRALDDKTTRFVSSRIHNFSHLESIEVYTVRDNVNLVDILKAMDTSSEKLPDEKDNSALKGYFGKVFPDLDFDRVYSSDLKKMVKWFSVLKANQIEIKLSEAAPEEEDAEEVGEVAVAEAPAAAAAAAQAQVPAASVAKKKAGKTEEAPAKKEEVKVKSEAPADTKGSSAEKQKVKKAGATEEAPEPAAPAAKKKAAKKKS